MQNPPFSPYNSHPNYNNLPQSSLLESSSSHLIALSPQSLPPDRIRVKVILGEKVNQMVHALPSNADQRFMSPAAAAYHNHNAANNGNYNSRGVFSSLVNGIGGGGRGASDALKGWIGIIMFVLGILGWRQFRS